MEESLDSIDEFEENLTRDEPMPEEENEEDQLGRIEFANRARIKIIDDFINKLWSKRVMMKTFINLALVGSALYNGVPFIVCIVLTAIFHIIDANIDFDIHKMHQKKEYAKYGI